MDRHDRYLQNLIRSASPARLRLLLIERGIEIAESLAATAAEPTQAATHSGKSLELVRAEQTLRLRDILGELLSGVVNKELEVAKQVADLYVFLLQYMGEAERQDTAERWERIVEILRIEQETWARVCEHATRSATPDAASSRPLGVSDFGAGPPVAGALNLQG